MNEQSEKMQPSMPTVVPIEEEVFDGKCDPRWMCDKYYTKKYVCTPNGNDYCYNIHSNKIIVVTLAPSHYILRHAIQPTMVDFQVTAHTSRLENSMTGKGKRGAQQLSETSNLCSIKCDNCAESPFMVRANLVGKLIEVNENLVEHPELLLTGMNGYIAIILPRFSDFHEKIKKLLDEEQYLEITKKYQEASLKL